MKTRSEDPGRPEAGSPAGGGDLPAPEPEELEAEVVATPQAEPGAESPAAEPGALAELRDKWLRAEADIQNVRRRAAREREEQRREIEDQWLLELAALQDDLDRALDTAREGGAPESWTRGVELVRARIAEQLTRHGVAVMDPVGQPFDPNLHEALLEVAAPAGEAPGTVVQVVARGFARGGRALRAARVVVARAAGEAGS